MEADKEPHDILDSDRKEYAISSSLLKQRVSLILLILFMIFLTGVAVITMLAFYDKMQAWQRNSFVVAFEKREVKFGEMRDLIASEMEKFKQVSVFLEARLDNQQELALVALLERRERDDRAFIKLLIKAAYRLAVQVQGARTWYEQYSDKLARLVNSSHLTQMKLKQLEETHHPLYSLPEALEPNAPRKMENN